MFGRRFARASRGDRGRAGALVAALVLVPVLVLGGLQLSFATDDPAEPLASSESTVTPDLFESVGDSSSDATGSAGLMELASVEATDVMEPASIEVAAAGSYSIKWSAADPAPNNFSWAPTYDKLAPSYLAVQLGVSYPLIGRQADPLSDAVAYGPTSAPSDYDAVQSLMPQNLALGTVVPFQMEVVVSGSTAPENGTITVNPYWHTMTTSGSNFGFDPNYGVIAAFVDTDDEGR